MPTRHIFLCNPLPKWMSRPLAYYISLRLLIGRSCNARATCRACECACMHRMHSLCCLPACMHAVHSSFGRDTHSHTGTYTSMHTLTHITYMAGQRLSLFVRGSGVAERLQHTWLDTYMHTYVPAHAHAHLFRRHMFSLYLVRCLDEPHTALHCIVRSDASYTDCKQTSIHACMPTQHTPH